MKFAFFSVSENGENGLGDEEADGGNFGARTAPVNMLCYAMPNSALPRCLLQTALATCYPANLDYICTVEDTVSTDEGGFRKNLAPATELLP